MAARLARLKQRAEFLAVAGARRKAPVAGLVLQALPVDDAGRTRVGFTVTKKVGNAVVRNRAKRRLRAAADALMPNHAAPGHDYVLIGRDATGARPWPLLKADLEMALRKLHLWRDAEGGGE